MDDFLTPDALDILKAEPDYDELVSVLMYLDAPPPSSSSGRFSISDPSPESSRIIHFLVSEIAPNYWPLLSEGGEGSGGHGHADVPEKRPQPPHRIFVSCLLNIAGVNAVVVQLRALTRDSKLGARGGGGAPPRADAAANLALFLDLLSVLLDRDDAILTLWRRAAGGVSTEALRKTLLNEVVNLVAGGKIVSATAEAEGVCRLGQLGRKRWWMGDGAGYASWVARNVAELAKATAGEDGLKLCGTLFTRSLRLGYSDIVIQVVVDNLLLATPGFAHRLVPLLSHVSCTDQKNAIFAFVHYLSTNSLVRLDPDDVGPNPQVSAAAGLLATLIGGDAIRKTHLISWLTNSSGAGVGEGVAIRRAAVAALGKEADGMVEVAEGTLRQFGDSLYIKHAPMLQQEAHAQALLLSVGYLNRLAPVRLTMLVRSGDYMTAISNRIGASAPRSRFLGMIIGEALSALIDSEDRRLSFKVDEVETEEARWYKSLVDVADEPGPFDILRSDSAQKRSESEAVAARPPPSELALRPSSKKTTSAPKKPPPRPVPSTAPVAAKPRIQIIDSDDDEEEDLKPYPKPVDTLLSPSLPSAPDPAGDHPGHDPDEDANDPTLMHTERPPAPPVYIRQLLLYLRATTDYDRQRLGLACAADLIRRKARHGAEVSSHADELASLLSGLHDEFSMDGFEEMRRAAMVALVVGRPGEMGPWFARAVWEGDFSGGQRASILVALGLGARELAGFERTRYGDDDDGGGGGGGEGRLATMVGERLPARLEKKYLQAEQEASPGQGLKPLPRNALDTAAQSITSSFLAPLAAAAADAITGPDALKLTTFSSRLGSGTTTTPNSSRSSGRGGAPPPRPRVRPIPNTTAAILSASFFSPLAARLRHALHSSVVAGPSWPQLLQPYLVALYIRTLAVILHASGPSTASLPRLTAETWDLLLAARALCRGEVGVAAAVLTGVAALLEVNDPAGDGGGLRRLVEEHGREVLETREWAATLFEGLRGDGGGERGGEEGEAKGLAAGVLMRLGEAVEKYRLLLVGDMVGM